MPPRRKTPAVPPPPEEPPVPDIDVENAEDDDSEDDAPPEEMTTAAAAASGRAAAAAARSAAAALAKKEKEARAQRAARAAERDEERRKKNLEKKKKKKEKGDGIDGGDGDGNGEGVDGEEEEEGLDLLPQDVLQKLAAARKRGEIAPGRLASAADEKASGALQQKIKANKNKRIKKFPARRVAGPVTVVALDAAVSSPSGATPSALDFLRRTRGSRPRSASMLLPASALAKTPAFGFFKKKKEKKSAGMT